MFVTQRVLKIKHFFFFQFIANKKNSKGYHTPMIDLGESEKVTAVFKCQELPGVIIFGNYFYISIILNT